MYCTTLTDIKRKYVCPLQPSSRGLNYRTVQEILWFNFQNQSVYVLSTIYSTKIQHMMHRDCIIPYHTTYCGGLVRKTKLTKESTRAKHE